MWHMEREKRVPISGNQTELPGNHWENSPFVKGKHAQFNRGPFLTFPLSVEIKYTLVN